MKHFKQLKPGMSLIEVMAAIAIFAIFGSSLFMMQQYLFDRLMISQEKLIANLRMQEELIAYQTAILKESFEQDGIVEKSLQEKTKEFTKPDMTITITAKSELGVIAGQENIKSPFKNFKNVHLIRAQASSLIKATTDTSAATKPTHEGSAGAVVQYAQSYLFMYFQEVAKK
jgi:prepilin-type N-terminal cleavage/methylation domain-containing protein